MFISMQKLLHLPCAKPTSFVAAAAKSALMIVKFVTDTLTALMERMKTTAVSVLT